MPGVEEEDEEEEVDEEIEYEEVDQFGPELAAAATDAAAGEGTSDVGFDTAPVTPLSPLAGQDDAKQLGGPLSESPSVPLTAEALAKLGEEEQKKEAAELMAAEDEGKGKAPAVAP